MDALGVTLFSVACAYALACWGYGVGYAEARYETAHGIARILRAGRPRASEEEEKTIRWIEDNYPKPK